MMGRTHLAMGILCGEVFVLMRGCGDANSVSFAIAACTIGALLPDIDHPQSTLATSNRVSQRVSNTVSAVTQHRGITHTLFAALLLYCGIRYFFGRMTFPYGKPVADAVLIGYISHLLLDTLNERGVMWLWPISSAHIHIGRLRAGSTMEIVLRVIINAFATIGLFVVVYNFFRAFVDHF